MRKSLSALGAATLTAGLVLVGAGSASAHVTVTPSTTTADAYSLLTFGVPHGCGDSSTTKVSIQIPEEIVTVTPSVNPGWDVEKVMEELDEPLDNGHGGFLTERAAEVVYTAREPLPHDLRDAFEISVKLPDAAGETLVFPAVQECEEGESAWIQVPADGQSAHELELPAPMFEVTAAEEGAEASTEASAAGSDAAAASDGSAGTPVATWVALLLGAGGLGLGLLALLRTRRDQA